MTDVLAPYLRLQRSLASYQEETATDNEEGPQAASNTSVPSDCALAPCAGSNLTTGGREL